MKDCRRIPIRFRGYSISYRRSGVTAVGSIQPKWHAHVRIDRPTYSALKARLEQLAMHRTAENLATEFARTEFVPYAPIRRQILNILRSVNSLRQRQGFDLLPTSVLRLRRKPVKVSRERQATSEITGPAEVELSSTEGPCK